MNTPFAFVSSGSSPLISLLVSSPHQSSSIFNQRIYKGRTSFHTGFHSASQRHLSPIPHSFSVITNIQQLPKKTEDRSRQDSTLSIQAQDASPVAKIVYENALQEQNQALTPVTQELDSDFEKEKVSISDPEPETNNIASWDYIWPRAALLLVALVWGTNFGTVKVMQDSLMASEAAAGRFTLAALALAPTLRNVPKGLWLDGALIGLFVFLGYYTQSVSLTVVEANTSSFLCALTVIAVPLINFFMSKANKLWNRVKNSQEYHDDDHHTEKKSINWTAPLIALTGVAFLELSPQTSAFGIGDIWGIAQAFGFAMGFILNEKTVAKFPDHAIALSAIQVSTVALLSLLWSSVDASMAAHAPQLPHIGAMFQSNTMLLLALYTGIITTAGSIVVETLALQKVSASEMALLLSTEPVWAALFSATVLGEKLGPLGWFGGSLVIAACVVSQLSPNNNHSHNH